MFGGKPGSLWLRKLERKRDSLVFGAREDVGSHWASRYERKGAERKTERDAMLWGALMFNMFGSQPVMGALLGKMSCFTVSQAFDAGDELIVYRAGAWDAPKRVPKKSKAPSFFVWLESDVAVQIQRTPFRRCLRFAQTVRLKH